MLLSSPPLIAKVDDKPKLAIIGSGNMGSAIARQLSAGAIISLYDRHPDKTEILEKKGYGKSCDHLMEAVQDTDIIVLAIRPQNFDEIASSLSQIVKPNQLLVSIIGGLTLESLQKRFPQLQIIRMMPNIASQCGEGAIGLACHDTVSADNRKKTETLFSAQGKIYWLSENKMNAFTSLAASGPAFVFVMIESMIDAGIAMGLDANYSKDLALQTLKGSLALLEETKGHPGELKWKVTSPGGTTIAGLKKLEECSLRNAIISTYLTTYNRSIELSKEENIRQ